MDKNTSYLYNGVIYAADGNGGFMHPVTRQPLTLPAEIAASLDILPAAANPAGDSADATDSEDGSLENPTDPEIPRVYSGDNPNNEGTRAWFMHELDFLEVKFDPYAKLAELRALWEESSLSPDGNGTEV